MKFIVDTNNGKRIKFILLNLHYFECGNIQFTNMFDKAICLTDELKPHCQVKYKRFITTVIFLANIAKPKIVYR